MSAFSVILKKELVDNLRDRRAVTTALIMPLLGPLTLVAVFFAIEKAESKTHAPHVPVAGRENAPELVRFLEKEGVIVEPAPANAEEAVRTAKFDVVVRVPAAFGEQLRAGTPAVVELVCDPSRQDAAPTIGKIEHVIEGYGKEIGALRLLVRGVDPQIVTAVRAERVDVGAPGAERALLLASLPLFLLISCFVCGLYIAIDATAGEKERGSLEPLLLNPVHPTTVVLAKTAATIVFALIGVGVSLAAFSVVIPAVPFSRIGIDLQLSWRTLLGYALLYTPTTVLAASLQVFVGTLSKNTKTAQASLGLMMLGPMVPGFATSLFPLQPTLALCAVPSLGESIIALRLLRGEHVEALHWAANAGMDVVVAAALVVATAKLFGPRMLSG